MVNACTNRRVACGPRNGANIACELQNSLGSSPAERNPRHECSVDNLVVTSRCLHQHPVVSSRAQSFALGPMPRSIIIHGLSCHNSF